MTKGGGTLEIHETLHEEAKGVFDKTPSTLHL